MKNEMEMTGGESKEGLPECLDQSLMVNFLGLQIQIESNHRPLLEYVHEHFKGMSLWQNGTSSEICVRSYWLTGTWDPETHPFGHSDQLNTLGKRMVGNHRQLIWRNTLKMKGLQLRFQKKEKQYVFDVVYFFNPKKEKLDRLPEYEYKKYFSLTSYLTYYPGIWYLERHRGMTPIHASALNTEQGAVLIGGLGGVGKTTTCVALMQQANMTLISENLVLTDGTWIYPCFEPIRLNETSITMLHNQQVGLTPMKFPEGLKEKWLFHMDSSCIPEKTKPAALFLPVFSFKRYVKRVEPRLAAEKMIAMNHLTRELDDYYWYAAALNMQWPQENLTLNRYDALYRCLQDIPCFELGICREEGIQAVVEDITRHLS